MKKLILFGISFALLVSSAYASEGEMGSFGGISTGVQLETFSAMAQDNKKQTTTYTLPYKEMVYLSGMPRTVEGTIKIKQGKEIDKEKGTGNYTETYTISASDAATESSVYRTMTLSTDYVYNAELKQTTKTTKATKWTEIITVDGQTFELDDDKSNYTKSVLLDETPGVDYYRGDVHYDAVYTLDGEENSNVTLSVSGPIYGYDQVYAKSETQKRTITVNYGNGTGYAVEETPTYTVYRDIQYGSNEPTAISMAGNYKEIIRSEGTLSYNILKGNALLHDKDASGMISIESTPVIEQLSIPTNLNIAGHPAETQIKKMYSMKIFTDDASTFSANQVVTKQEYIAMLVKAFNMELPEEKTKSSRRKNTTEEVSPFTDIKSGDTYYKYAVAAYNAGLIDGGAFDGTTYLTRELMYTLNVKAMGLARLGIGTMDTYTPFVDDNQIASWAKSSIYAASKLGIINSANGYVFPKKNVTKAECATFLDQLISYLRYDLQQDYTDKMLIG